MKRIAAVALGLGVALSGCAAAGHSSGPGQLNITSGNFAYGGTIDDLALATYVPAYVAFALQPPGERPRELFPLFVFGPPLAAIDLPLSLSAETAALIYRRLAGLSLNSPTEPNREAPRAGGQPQGR